MSGETGCTIRGCGVFSAHVVAGEASCGEGGVERSWECSLVCHASPA